MSSDAYFAEDTIYRTNPDRSVEFGLVLKGAGCSHGVLEGPVVGSPAIKKHLAVAWGTTFQTGMVYADRVKLHDRAFIPGDVVTRGSAAGPIGFVRNRKVVAAVQVVGTDRVITGVETTFLEPLESMSTNMVVFHDGRVCVVLEVKRDLTVRFADGTVCIVKHEDTDHFEEVKEQGRCVGMFYRGQRLCGSLKCFENAHFLHRTKANEFLMSYSERGPLHVVVDYVTIVQVTVQDVTGSTSRGPNPLRVIQGRALERIKMLNAFEACAVVIGDHNYYQIKETDALMSLAEWKSQCASKYCPPQDRGDERAEPPTGVVYASNAQLADNSELTTYAAVSHQASVPMALSPLRRSRVFRRGKPCGFVRWPKPPHNWTGPMEPPSLAPNSTVVTVVLVTTSTVEVMWEDGTVGKDIPATELRSPSGSTTTTFLPGRFVVSNDSTASDRYAVIKSVDSLAKTAVIGMFKITAKNVNPMELEDKEVGLYDIKQHSYFGFVPGSCVLRQPTEERDSPEWLVGQVVDLSPEVGGVEVHWAAGWVTPCYPHELYHIGRYEHLWLKANEEVDDELGVDHGSNPSIVVLGVLGIPSGGAGGAVMVPPSHFMPANVPLGASLSMALTVEMLDDAIFVPPGLSNLASLKVGSSAPEGQQEDLATQIKYLEFSVRSLESHVTRDIGRHTCASLRKLVDMFNFYKRLEYVANMPYFYERILNLLVQCIQYRSRPVPRRLSARLRQLLLDYLREHPPALEEEQLATATNDLEPVHYLREHPPPLEEGQLATAMNNLEPVHYPREQLPPLEEGQLATAMNNLDPVHYLREHPPPLEEGQLVTATNSVEPVEEDEPPPLEGEEGADEAAAARAAAFALRELKWLAMGLNELCQLLAGLLEQRIERSRKVYEALFPLSSDAASQPEVEVAEGGESGAPDAETKVSEEDGGSAMEVEAKDEGARDNTEKAASDGVEEDLQGTGLGCSTPGRFTLVEKIPDGHKFRPSLLEPVNPKDFTRVVKREMKLLMTSLPDGIHVKAYEDRMDVYSVMIRGPSHTPYEDALFLFDLKLPPNYPHSPPHCLYLSFCKDRLNPNLYEDGKVCLSLLGTWPGQQQVETWSPGVSNLLQLLVSIQGLILVAEPYFLEPGYEREKGTAAGAAKSRQYNERTIVLVVQAMVRFMKNTPEVFKQEVMQHFKEHGARFISRREVFMSLSPGCEDGGPPGDSSDLPGFPLLPTTRGFRLSLRNALDNFKGALEELLAPTAPDDGQ